MNLFILVFSLWFYDTESGLMLKCIKYTYKVYQHLGVSAWLWFYNTESVHRSSSFKSFTLMSRALTSVIIPCNLASVFRTSWVLAVENPCFPYNSWKWLTISSHLEHSQNEMVHTLNWFTWRMQSYTLSVEWHTTIVKGLDFHGLFWTILISLRWRVLYWDIAN